MNKTPVLGLLGAIGSGKSTLAAILAKKGAVVLDADRYAADLLLDAEVRREIEAAFSKEVFDGKGFVDRGKLADIIFANEEDRAKAHAIIHPRVRARIKAEMVRAEADPAVQIIVLDIPLLLGSELKTHCDLIILITASLKTRVQRVAEHRGWTRQELLRREACQPSLEEKKAAADCIITNEGTLDILERKVERVLKTLRSQP
ncbi:MAG: dephospho-CoA kinase [Planctomycetes bacterium]|nr:dephospho-CoA kinase [Planctomycetota bacterium]